MGRVPDADVRVLVVDDQDLYLRAMMTVIDANAKAREMYDTLSSQNRYALAFRLAHIKTEVARVRNVAAFVAMLARGETFYPNKVANKVAQQPDDRLAKKPATKIENTMPTKKTAAKKSAR